MKSFIFSLVLICALIVPIDSRAQGRGAGAGGGRPAGAPEIPTRPEPAPSRPSAPDVDRGSRSNSAADGSANSDARKAQGTKDPSVQLANNSGLTTQVAKLFPTGTDLSLMSSGFKNLGQFVAAAHVSQNLQIPFDQLKVKVVTDGNSLSEAIHALKPDLAEKAVKDETRKAESQARKDLENHKA